MVQKWVRQCGGAAARRGGGADRREEEQQTAEEAREIPLHESHEAQIELAPRPL